MSVSLESPNYLVLLAIADEPMHALAVQRRIIGDTVGVYLPRMTVYDSLKALVAGNLAESRSAGWRVIYEITDEGRRRLEIVSKDRNETSKLARQRLGYR